MNIGLIAICILFIGILLMFFFYEKSNISIKEICLISTLAALAGVSRVAFTALPNIQPTTFLVILSGYVFGPIYGFMVGTVAALVSNSFMGHGPWTPWQMLAWGLAGISAGFLKRILPHPKKIPLSIFAFCWGFLFDYIMNLWQWLAFIHPHNLSSFIAVYAASFYFDLMHALCNFVFTYLLGNSFITVLSRFKDRIHYTEIP